MLKLIRNEPVVFMLMKMWRFASGYKYEIVLFWFLSFVANLIWMLPPIVFGLIINEVQVNGLTTINYLYLLLGVLFMIDLVGWLFHGPSRVMENLVGYKIDKNYKRYLYGGVLSLPLSWHTDHDSGDTIDKINKSTRALYDFSRHTFNLVRVVVRAIGTTIVLCYFNVYIGIFALLILIAAFYVIFMFDRKLVPQYRGINLLENKTEAKVYDAFSNITTVKVLGINKPVLLSVMTSSWASFKLFRENKILVEMKWFVGGMFFTALVVFPLLFYAWYEHLTGAVILVGTLSTLYLYLQNLIDVYYTFAGMYEEMIISKTRMQNVEEVEKEFEKSVKVNKKKVEGWKSLRIEDLNFSYGINTDTNNISNLNIEIRSGEKIAFIGESGSGKSTLLKILHGMYDTAKATVSVDGKKSFKTNFMNLEMFSTLVPQEPEVFSASIKENITLLLDFSDKEIAEAIACAEFSSVVATLPKGLDSVVNEKGVNLSGGQKQRLALARALLFSGDKKIILLDESTSSVDPVNEVQIYKNIFEKFKEATIIASIHKMNLLKYFDRIVILENGKIRDEGSFDELLVRDQEFRKSWEEFVLEGEIKE